jgi:WD40 repeat protein
MKIIMKYAKISVAFALTTVALLTVLAAASAPAIAQNATTKLQVIADSKANSSPFGAKQAISPDGLQMAHFGEASPSPTSLYVKNLASGEDKLIVKGPDGIPEWMVVANLAFSPDGSRLIFEESQARKGTGKIYTVKVDGSDMRMLASDDEQVPDSSGKNVHDIDVSYPLLSPDGGKVLVEVTVTNGKRNQYDGRDDSEDKFYLGLLSAKGENQTPKTLMQLDAGARPQLWSADGSAIYYTSAGLLYRFDTETKQSTPTAINTDEVEILGRAPGTDAVFTRNVKATVITVTSLDGTEASQELKDSAARIPFRDSDGRYLHSIDGAGPHQLLLTYEAGSTAKMITPHQHSQVVNFQ